MKEFGNTMVEEGEINSNPSKGLEAVTTGPSIGLMSDCPEASGLAHGAVIPIIGSANICVALLPLL